MKGRTQRKETIEALISSADAAAGPPPAQTDRTIGDVSIGDIKAGSAVTIVIGGDSAPSNEMADQDSADDDEPPAWGRDIIDEVRANSSRIEDLLNAAERRAGHSQFNWRKSAINARVANQDARPAQRESDAGSPGPAMRHVEQASYAGYCLWSVLHRQQAQLDGLMAQCRRFAANACHTACLSALSVFWAPSRCVDALRDNAARAMRIGAAHGKSNTSQRQIIRTQNIGSYRYISPIPQLSNPVSPHRRVVRTPRRRPHIVCGTARVADRGAPRSSRPAKPQRRSAPMVDRSSAAQPGEPSAVAPMQRCRTLAQNDCAARRTPGLLPA
ncbi:hypothetical protein [Salinisphaera orenii]|uniref:hypothetical protein n=1 Tax=Salinisphaera orenii TaxID=856731 RepID=UPI0011CD3FB0|nr:hypothetical protein [Salinisphaera halophila]